MLEPFASQNIQRHGACTIQSVFYVGLGTLATMNPQYRASHQQAGKKRKEDDPDAYMRLSDQEIVGCTADIGVPFSEADLRNPKPQQVQMAFEHLGDILMNATRDSIDPAMRAASEDICGEYPDLIPADTRLMMGLFIRLRWLMEECGVRDFSMNDLVRPTYERLGKILSYVINFIRFREGQTDAIDENFNKAHRTKDRIETLYTENDDMQQRLEDMRRNRKAMEAAVKEKIRKNDELKARLLELRKAQERISLQGEQSKEEKGRAHKLLEEKTERLVRSRQECEKLRPYVLQSAAALQDDLTELTETLAREKSQIDMLERRLRALQTSCDSFGMVQNDVQLCNKVLEEIAIELQKEEEEENKAARNKEALDERGADVREIEQNELHLQRQLSRWEERIEELRRKHREREEANKVRMEELWEMQRQLRDERAAKGREMDRRKGRIDQTEKKVRIGVFFLNEPPSSLVCLSYVR